MRIIVVMVLLAALSTCAASVPKPAPVDEYPIHKDGGLIYDPLRREAKKTGQLAGYHGARKTHGRLELDGLTLRYSVPEKAVAYDVIPVDYELTWKDPAPEFPIAVEATGFEEESRRQGRDLFDLALPGKIDLKIDFVGSITANMNGKRHNLKPDMSDTPGHYPGYDRHEMTTSGVIEAGDMVWFKFRITNTGNTILDPEGIGGYCLYPEIHKKNEAGEYQSWGHHYNLYIRDLEYLYPGETHEVWVHFVQNMYQLSTNPGLQAGEYLVKMKFAYRYYKHFNPWTNIWDGAVMHNSDFAFSVEPKPRQAPVPQGIVTVTDGGDKDKITRWIHTHEEFMTAFDCHLKKPGKSKTIKNTLYLQIAPWTENVTIKLINAPNVSIKTAAVPIDINSDSLKIKFKPDHQMTLVKNGLHEPCIWSQCMADMRSNIQIGPYPEVHIRERMREMMDCGINVTAFTSMSWLYDDMHNPKMNFWGDSLKYYLDCARKEGMYAEGWGTYPYNRIPFVWVYNWLTGENLRLAPEDISGPDVISYSYPYLHKVNSTVWMYQFHRWGDLFYQMQSGEVPFGSEDTRGWMRQDLNIRYPIGEDDKKQFRKWCEAKYGTIDATNKAWNSQYKSFGEIDPQAGQVINSFGHQWEYMDKSNQFHDWNAAVADFDRFRTQLRVDSYRKTLDELHKEIPTAKVLIRTEGANVLVDDIDPLSNNPHMRHIYYSQRRCALVADIIQKSGTVRWHSDYTTLPYTPSELRQLTKMAVAQGIIPIYLAQFDNMRDIAINREYGTPFETHYNLPEPRKGQMMHVLTALYPWFKTVYEEGGVPGLLWEDYQCDGFATVTQKREMRFFKKKLHEAMNTPDAIKLRTRGDNQPSQEWRKNVRSIECYKLEE